MLILSIIWTKLRKSLHVSIFRACVVNCISKRQFLLFLGGNERGWATAGRCEGLWVFPQKLQYTSVDDAFWRIFRLIN